MDTCLRQKADGILRLLVKSHCRHRDAEGFESRTRSLFVDLLGRAKASAGEARCQLYVAHDQGYVDDGTFDEVYDLAEKVSRQLYRLIHHLEDNPTPDRVHELPSEYLSR